jgi:thiol-disulfide isomerase/thioredoxin
MNHFKLFFFLTITFSVLLSCSKEKKKNIVNDIKLETGTHESVYFKTTEKYYYSNQPDTTLTQYDVWIKKDPADSLRNGFVWVDNHYRPYNMIYENGTFYLAIPPKKTTVPYPDYTEDFISAIDWIDIFLKPEKFTELTSKNNTVISNIEFKGEPCSKIEISLPKDKNGKETIQTYIISKKNLFPVYAKMIIKDDQTTYTNELDFHNVIFDDVNLKELKERQKRIFAANPLEPEGADSETAITERMLHIGTKAPLFEGTYYGTDKTFKLADHIGKDVILVDFWYTHCPPCVRAMPALSELYTKYKNKGLKIYGLNSVDNQPRSMDNLNKFLKKRKLGYEVILTRPEVDQVYKIKAYPSMYVIDKQGDVSFIEVGYDEEKFEKVIEHIEKLINQ